MRLHLAMDKIWVKVPILAMVLLMTGCGSSEIDCAARPPTGIASQKLLLGHEIDVLLTGAAIAGRDKLYKLPSVPLVEFLRPALERDPDNLLVLQFLVGSCRGKFTEEGLRSLCAKNPLEKLISLEPQNGVYRIIQSTRLHEIGEVDAALSSLEAAGRSDKIDVLDAQQTAIYTKVLREYFPDQGECALAQSSRLAMVSTPAFSPLYMMCDAQMHEDERWAEACLNAGEAMEKKGRSLAVTVIGIGLQEKVLREIGDLVGMKEAAGRKSDVKAFVERAYDLPEIYLADKVVQDLWLRNSIELGEEEATRIRYENFEAWSE